METALEIKKQRIIKRLESTIETANTLLMEINEGIEGIIANNSVLERTAIIYDTWISKE